MIIELLAFIVLAIVLLLLIGYFYLKDKTQSEKLVAYERAIDDLNARLHDIEGEGGGGIVLSDDTSFKQDIEELEKRLSDQINELGDHVLNAIRAIKDMELKIQDIDEQTNQKVQQIEQNIKKFTAISPVNSTADEEIILDMYKKGYSAKEIAKSERIPIGEVELILKISNLR